MKTVVIDIKDPVEGDLVIVNYCSPRGGKTSAKHAVAGVRKRPQLDAEGFATLVETVPAETARDVAQALVGQISKEWPTEGFQAGVKDDTGALVIKCADVVSDVIFSVEVAGEGGTTFSMMEF